MAKAGGELDQVATMTVYTTERRWGRQFTSNRKDIFKKGFPASAFVEARKLRTPGALLQIPAIAVLDERKGTMGESPQRTFIDPLPQLGLSRAVKVTGGSMAFLAGHTAREMAHVNEAFDFTVQAKKTFERIRTSVESAGGQLSGHCQYVGLHDRHAPCHGISECAEGALRRQSAGEFIRRGYPLGQTGAPSRDSADCRRRVKENLCRYFF